MSHGDWLRCTLLEGWYDLSPILVIGWLAAAAVRSRLAHESRTRASMRGTLFLLALHLVSLPLLGTLAAHSGASVAAAASYDRWRNLSFTFATFAGVTITLVLVFDGLLHALRVDFPRILADVVAAAAYVVAGIVLLHRWGVNLSGLIATSAVMTAVLGFSLQDTLGNLMGGIALQLEQSIRVGDWLKVGTDIGRVTEIRWRKTAIETRNWETVVIPNSLLSKGSFTILGRRQGEAEQWRRWIYFNVDYRFPPTLVMRTAAEAMTHAPIAAVAAEPAAHCLLMDMRESFNSYAARYWLTDLARDDGTDSEVRTRIFFALKRAGIPLTMPAHAIFLTNESEGRRQRKERDDDQQRLAALRQVEMFHSFSPAELDALADGLRYSPFAAGEVLTRQGAEGHDLYLIASGRVTIRVNALGAEREVATLEAGAFFGEQSLMTGEPRNATTVALTDVVCYRLAKGELEALIKQRPEIAEDLAETLAARNAALDSVRKDLSAAARQSKLAEDKSQFLDKIRSFFGL